MSPAFQEQIQNFPHPLFYNSSGSPTAYKLGIRHLSAAPSAGVARRVGNSIYPNDVIYLVDLETQKIERVKERVKLIRLQNS